MVLKNVLQGYETIFGLLETALQKLDRHEQLLLEIARRQAGAGPVQADSEENDAVDLPRLPCESREDLQELNTLLENSGAARKKLIRIISLVGGTGAIVVNNTLKSIVGHNVSKTFNMIGTKGKESFAALQSINSIIKKGVRANRGMKETSDKDIASWCGRWFTNARDRKGDRLARRLAKPQIAEDVLPVEDVLLVEEEIVGADSD
ncbi:uncharacterized protein LOC121417911 [Lytechinus variegatus]|uniref:uncharacterized protein LOC121417911 n=1 Tax=Lytechinus variegatus TaxID=7654 RepID=UPI001BB0E4A2|nr:uncharacterized protein LOC121417911 [Lytechinus variegatus]